MSNITTIAVKVGEDTSIFHIDTNSSKVVHFVGTTTTAITASSPTRTIAINGQSYTAQNGDLVIYDGNKFMWDGDTSVWTLFGGGLGPDVQLTSGFSVDLVETIANGPSVVDASLAGICTVLEE